MTRMVTALGIVIATAAAPILAQRFDTIVRADFFAGFRGDEVRFARGMATCEKALAANPHDAAALVWHGGGLFYQSGLTFRAGDWKTGVDLQTRGLNEMDEGVALKPDDLQTRIPRGAVLLAGAPFFPPEYDARPLVQKAVGDYEKALQLQRAGFPALAPHSRGELLGGLAVGYRLMGDRDRETAFLKRIVAELPGTAYETRARTWLQSPDAVKKTDRFCIGCHE